MPSTANRSRSGRANSFRLMVAIADVSHYVKPNDALDADALERSTSVYFPRRVIPMLPEKLSNGLCSLNPAVDRLTLVCDAVVIDKGEVKAYQFYPAVIHSAARLTYNEVADILGNTKGPEAAAPSGHRAAPAEPVRRVPRAAEGTHRSAAPSTSRPPKPISSAMRWARSRRSSRAPATMRTADRRVHAGGQRLRGRSAAAPQAPGHLPHPRQRRPRKS